MHGYNDINGFASQTGMHNYKILSAYNADNALSKWSVIENINGLVVADAITPLITGAEEFNNIPALSPHIPEPMDVQPPLVASPPERHAVIEPSAEKLPPAPRSQPAARAAAPTTGTAFSEREKERFGTLFKREIPSPVNNPQAQPQRELPLSTLFNRIASCR
jgi:hypothetical protein